MKTITKGLILLNLTLTIILSMNICAMEKKENALEKMTKEPIGFSTTSSDVGMELQTTDEDKKKLKTAIEQLKIRLKTFNITTTDSMDMNKNIVNSMKKLSKETQEIIDLAYRMYFGDTDVDLNSIREQMKKLGITPQF